MMHYGGGRGLDFVESLFCTIGCKRLLALWNFVCLMFKVCIRVSPFKVETVNTTVGLMSPSIVSMSHYVLDFAQYHSWSNG